MPTTNWKLGRDCTLSIAGSELSLAKEVTVELAVAEGDATCRASEGVKRTVQALRELTISGTALYSPDNAAIAALLEAQRRDFPVGAMLSDPTLDYEDMWWVTSLSQPQPLEDAVTIDFTLKATDGARVIGTNQQTGYLLSEASSWSDVLRGSGTLTAYTDDNLVVDAQCDGIGFMSCKRAYLRFDTSALSGLTVASARLLLICANPNYYLTRTLRLRALAADYEELTVDDWNAAEAGDPVDVDVPAGDRDTPLALTVPAAWISTTSYTCLILRERLHDCGDSTPGETESHGASPYGHAGSGATGNQPKLLVWAS